MKAAVSGLLFIFLITLFSTCNTTRTSALPEGEIAENAGVLSAGAAEVVPENEPAPAEPPPPPPPEPNFPYTIAVKAAPPELEVFLNETALAGRNMGMGVKNYVVSGAGTLKFSAAGYDTLELYTYRIPGILRHKQLSIKLEKYDGFLKRIQEIDTGSQPKSAYFSPSGDRLFVPLLNESGIDVFRFSTPDRTGAVLSFETRLAVPESNARGFVEAMIDERRREVWVSNMEENRVHIYDLDTLEYKIHADTKGVMPKVITQSPDGKIVAVSNWFSQNISVFDSDTKKLLYRIPVGGTPRGMAFSPDSGLLYVAIFDEALIQVLDMSQRKVIKSFRFHNATGAARHVIYHEGKLIVSDMYQGNVCILDAATGKLLRSKRVGPNINTIVLSPDGKRIFASSRGRNNPDDYTVPGPEFGAVYALSSEDLTLQEKVWGRNQPTGLAVTPDGAYMVFTDFLDANMEVYKITRN